MPGCSQWLWVEVDCGGKPLSALVRCWAIISVEGAGGEFSMVVSHIVFACSHCLWITVVLLPLSGYCHLVVLLLGFVIITLCCVVIVLC